MADTSSFPLVSVSIPTYNGELRIGEAIRSLQAQQYPHMEIIISDNASTDNTEAVVRQFMAEDERIRYYRHPQNLGIPRNFQFGLEQAKGQYFIWLSDDDQLLDGVIKRYVDFLEAQPEFSMVSGIINYTEAGNLVSQERHIDLQQASGILRCLEYYARVKEGGMYYGMMRRELGQKLCVSPTIGSDWHFVAGLAYLGKIKILDFVGYRKSRGGVSNDFHDYVKSYGEKAIWGYVPFIKIGLDAAAEVIYRADVFKRLNLLAKLFTGSTACLLVWGHYYGLIVPRMGAGWLLRKLKIKTPKQRSLERVS
ncbi:MAG: glycosyltransferase family 2 protein [Bacteroidota bacterium]